MFVSELERLVDEQKDNILLVYPPKSTIVPFSSMSEIPAVLTWGTLKWCVLFILMIHSHNGKKPNQDRVLVYYEEKSGLLLLGIFDGHGNDGHRVASLVRNRYLLEFAKVPFLSSANVLQQMRAALNEAEKQLHAEGAIDSKRSGCTANIGVVIPSSSDAFTLYSLNVGDSEWVLSSSVNVGAICRSRRVMTSWRIATSTLSTPLSFPRKRAALRNATEL